MHLNVTRSVIASFSIVGLLAACSGSVPIGENDPAIASSGVEHPAATSVNSGIAPGTSAAAVASPAQAGPPGLTPPDGSQKDYLVKLYYPVTLPQYVPPIKVIAVQATVSTIVQPVVGGYGGPLQSATFNQKVDLTLIGDHFFGKASLGGGDGTYDPKFKDLGPYVQYSFTYIDAASGQARTVVGGNEPVPVVAFNPEDPYTAVWKAWNDATDTTRTEATAVTDWSW